MPPLTPQSTTHVSLDDLGASHHPLQAQLDAAIAQVCADGEFVGGPHVRAFEQSWANYSRVPYAVGVANGTDALHLALRGLGLGANEEIILPANAFIGTADAVLLAGATPVFCDVDEETLLLDPMTVDAVVSPRTAAVIAVHLYGHVVGLEELKSYTRERGIVLIEDASHAHGARYKGRPVGSFGDAGCFGFEPDKNLGALGDAGAVLCHDPALADRVRSLSEHGRDVLHPGYHPIPGTQSQLDAIQAAALSVKLPHLDRWNAARRAVVERYEERLAGTAAELVMPTRKGSVHHRVVVRVPHRDLVQERLAEQDIDSGVHYAIPCHLQEPFRRYANGRLPVVEQAALEVLSLPLFPQLSDATVDRVADALVSALAWAAGQQHSGR